MQELQDIILGLEHSEGVGDMCGCGVEGASAYYHCRDCMYNGVSCKTCIVTHHTHSPFHRIEEWEGHFFTRTTLSALGFVLYLGHNGDACPHMLPESGHSLVIVHPTGIHTHLV